MNNNFSAFLEAAFDLSFEWCALANLNFAEVCLAVLHSEQTPTIAATKESVDGHLQHIVSLPNDNAALHPFVSPAEV